MVAASICSLVAMVSIDPRPAPKPLLCELTGFPCLRTARRALKFNDRFSDWLKVETRFRPSAYWLYTEIRGENNQLRTAWEHLRDAQDETNSEPYRLNALHKLKDLL